MLGGPRVNADKTDKALRPTLLLNRKEEWNRYDFRAVVFVTPIARLWVPVIVFQHHSDYTLFEGDQKRLAASAVLVASPACPPIITSAMNPEGVPFPFQYFMDTLINFWYVCKRVFELMFKIKCAHLASKRHYRIPTESLP
ncbi:uncharacterized protein LOC114362939 [Ostrinia furnacalis]|uniref:uncharacterized protein LOC114362939 n=1 Tax=Ostrinia furnacalis TaxID=93504 RepID=UPI00103A9596|nr:uncharacterized protein LOC114362939 [Ostrinia furnacalis]